MRLLSKLRPGWPSTLRGFDSEWANFSLILVLDRLQRADARLKKKKENNETQLHSHNQQEEDEVEEEAAAAAIVLFFCLFVCIYVYVYNFVFVLERHMIYIFAKRA